MENSWIAIPGLIKNKRNEKLIKQMFNADIEWYESDKYGIVLIVKRDYDNSPTLKFMGAIKFEEVKNEWIIV